MALVHLGTDQIQNVEQPAMLTTTGQHQSRDATSGTVGDNKLIYSGLDVMDVIQ